MTSGSTKPSAAAAPFAARPGRVLAGRYRLVRPIGRGASAWVWLAEDPNLKRQVAIKMLHDGLVADSKFLDRFRAEAQAAAALSHPNVLAVHDWGEHEIPFLVTEHLGGGSLRSMLDAESTLSPSQAIGVGLEACRGLHFAHRQRFVHRDIKPANLLFGEDARLRIADFGLARAIAESGWTEPNSNLVGTVRYASPEQAQGKRLTGKSDVYSLGLTLIEAVTGEPVFTGDTAVGVLMARVEQDVVIPDLPPRLADALRAMTVRNPEERPDSAKAGVALLGAAEGLPRPGALVLAPPAVRLEPDPAPNAVAPAVDPAPAAPTEPDVDASVDAQMELVDNSSPMEDEDSPSAAENSPAAPVATAAPTVPAAPVPESAPAEPQTPEPSAAEKVAAARSALEDTRQAPVVDLDSTQVADIDVDATEHAGPPVVRSDDDDGPTRRWPWLVITTLAIAAAAWFAYNQFEASIPAELAVPDVVGLDRDAALAELGDTWLVSEKLDRVADVPQGAVIRTEPAAGELLAEGETVDYWISLGLPLVRVPNADIVGRSQEQAAATLEAIGLTVGEITRINDETVGAGLVISVEAAAPELPQGDPVDLTVSLGPVTRVVPAPQAGLDIAVYIETLAEQGLGHTLGEVFDEEVLAGEVISINPEPGSDIERGGVVEILVSLGPEPVPVPDISGELIGPAIERLELAGFVPIGEGNFRCPAVGTDPPEGSLVQPGEPVTVILTECE